MARSQLCRVCRDWHDLDKDWPIECADHFPKRVIPRHGLSVPMVIMDSMDAVESQTNGIVYDSKSALRAEYKRAGVIELGNEKIKPKPQPTAAERRKDIRIGLEKSFAKLGL